VIDAPDGASLSYLGLRIIAQIHKIKQEMTYWSYRIPLTVTTQGVSYVDSEFGSTGSPPDDRVGRRANARPRYESKHFLLHLIHPFSTLNK
jgi:hypothetical protein